MFSLQRSACNHLWPYFSFFVDSKICIRGTDWESKALVFERRSPQKEKIKERAVSVTF